MPPLGQACTQCKHIHADKTLIHRKQIFKTIIFKQGLAKLLSWSYTCNLPASASQKPAITSNNSQHHTRLQGLPGTGDLANNRRHALCEVKVTAWAGYEA